MRYLQRGKVPYCQARKQENAKSRAMVARKTQADLEHQEEELVDEKVNEYLEKRRLIDELERQKEIDMLEIGQAHRAAVNEAQARVNQRFSWFSLTCFVLGNRR